MSDLPPLPHPSTSILTGDDWDDVFTRDQMHAYARMAIAAALAVRPPCPHIHSSGPPDRATNWCALNGPAPLRYPHGSLGEEA